MTKKKTPTTKKLKKRQKVKKRCNNQENKLFFGRISKRKTIIALLLFGILLIVATYAWFSSALNVRIRTFRMAVDRNSGLTISLDAINYDSYVDITEDTILNNLVNTYPTNKSLWVGNGLVPVSSNGITNHNSPDFNIFTSEGVLYQRIDIDNGFIYTTERQETQRKKYSYYLAFDIFLRNETGSPVSDNLYFDRSTSITIAADANEEMQGLGNSIRVGIVKIDSATLDAPATAVQNLSCNNDCNAIIYEPNSRNHTNLSIERARKYNVNLVNGQRFPTYAVSRAGGPIFVANTVSGSPNIDPNYFTLQNTITEEDFSEPIFEIPNGITKARVYLWVEGQDIDSLETNSEGTDLDISISFVKDTEGYTTFNE